MSILQDSVTKLKALYSFGKRISIIDSAKHAGTQRTILLEKIFEKILLHDHSILVLLGVIPDQTRELDVSLIASAARNIMETANLYFHISQRGIDGDDLEFRVETMALNELYNEIDITEKLGFSRDCDHARLNKWFYQSASQRFEKFPQFVRLSQSEKNQVLSGRKPAFRMKSPRILEVQMESAVYNLLSNSLHSLPLGLSSNSINRTPFFNNFFGAERLLTVALQVSDIYTAHVIKDYLDLRKRFYALFTPEERETLKSCMSANDLAAFIRTLRAEYERDIF